MIMMLPSFRCQSEERFDTGAEVLGGKETIAMMPDPCAGRRLQHAAAACSARQSARGLGFSRRWQPEPSARVVISSVINLSSSLAIRTSCSSLRSNDTHSSYYCCCADVDPCGLISRNWCSTDTHTGTGGVQSCTSRHRPSGNDGFNASMLQVLAGS